MDTQTTISISEARKTIFDIADKVQSPNNIYTLTERGKPKVVMMSAQEFESWQETMEVTKEFPDIKKDIKNLEKDLACKKHKKYTSLDDIIKKEYCNS